MKKIVFLGCENSHSAMFLDYLQSSEKYKDTQVIGVYSHEEAAAKKLAEKYGVPVMNSYDEAAGIADGVVITARHGDNHYKYAKRHGTNFTIFFAARNKKRRTKILSRRCL